MCDAITSDHTIQSTTLIPVEVERKLKEALLAHPSPCRWVLDASGAAAQQKKPRSRRAQQLARSKARRVVADSGPEVLTIDAIPSTLWQLYCSSSTWSGRNWEREVAKRWATTSPQCQFVEASVTKLDSQVHRGWAEDRALRFLSIRQRT